MATVERRLEHYAGAALDARSVAAVHRLPRALQHGAGGSGASRARVLPYVGEPPSHARTHAAPLIAPVCHPSHSPLCSKAGQPVVEVLLVVPWVVLR